VTGGSKELDRLNGHELMTSSPRQSKTQTDANHFVLTFENNRYASELFGQFDQHLKLIEQRLGIDARARGNSVSISGDVVATNQARRALDYLYGRSVWRSRRTTSFRCRPWSGKPS
jgi:phosphate starvation-inducible protein PhoH and related proteins